MTLTEPQIRASITTHPKVLVVAGPGSGKTTVLAKRITHLIESGVQPEGIVAISYTNSAADEIRSRVGNDQVFVGTLHAFMGRLIQKHWNWLGYSSPRLTTLDEDETENEFERIAQSLGYNGRKVDRYVALERVARTGKSLARDTDIAASGFLKFLRRNNLITFDTTLYEGLRLVSGFDCDLSYQHLLVDEFQDASEIDLAIYNALPIQNKWFCGDPDQSIFGFRGGDMNGILSLAAMPDVEEIHLEENYRCSPLICDAANNLIRNNPYRIDKETVPVTTDPGTVEFNEFGSSKEEQATIANRIASDYHRGFTSIAVLVRSNALVAEWVAKFEMFGIDVAKRSFTHRPKDWEFTRAAVAVLSDPSNDWLNYQFLLEGNNPIAAGEAWTAAKACGKPLRAFEGLQIPSGVEIDAYGLILARIGASKESIQLVESTVERMPPGATGADLHMALSQTVEDSHDIGSGVYVGTIHSAKGKEWDSVYLPSFSQDVIPGTAKSRDLDEERRLAFVAITRARHHVTISWSRERRTPYGVGFLTNLEPSQFIKETMLIPAMA